MTRTIPVEILTGNVRYHLADASVSPSEDSGNGPASSVRTCGMSIPAYVLLLKTKHRLQERRGEDTNAISASVMLNSRNERISRNFQLVAEDLVVSDDQRVVMINPRSYILTKQTDLR